jgi:spermine oxidase
LVNAQDPPETRSIIIVGAGLSGYSAAARLLEKGFTDVKVFEAENRIGGRIHSIPAGDGKIDLGAQWCHGETGNIIYKIVNKTFDFGTTPFDTIDQRYISSDASSLDQTLLNKLSSMFYNVMKTSDAEMGVYNGPFGTFVWDKFLIKLAASTYANTDPALIAIFKEHMHREIIGHYAANSWDDVSAKLNSRFADAGGNQHLTWKKSGFITFFDYITVGSQYLNKQMLMSIFFILFLEKRCARRGIQNRAW